jgi:general secretion pathway protein C
MIKIGFNILNILFLTIGIYFAVDSGYDFMGAKMDNPLPGDKAPREVAPIPEDAPRPPDFYQPIVARNLFQSKRIENQNKPAPTEVDLDTLNKTQLQLKLWGTVASAGNESYAVIESDTDRHQNLYRVGDTVSGASLKRILREKVVLTVAGKDEILEIQKPVNQSTMSPFGNRPPMPAQGPAPAAPPPGANAGAVSKRRITLQRAQVESAMGNISQLMGEAKLEPNLTDGNPNGLLITDVKPNSLFRRMGLRNGDVILGVDGKPIESVDDALRLYENLKAADGASLDIKRRGQNQTIEYKIK